MKRFTEFIVEANKTGAAKEAMQKGLVYDRQKAGWINPVNGELIARTEKGKLLYMTPREKKQEQQPQMSRTPVVQQSAPRQRKAITPTTPKGATKDTTTGEGETSDTITIVFGRFNPPTIGHERLFKTAQRLSVDADLKIYPSRTVDPKKNPLDTNIKVQYMKKMFPDFEENIINDKKMDTIFNVLVLAAEDGYVNVNIVVGSDRQAEFESLANKYNGKEENSLYNFEQIRVISAGVRDADAEGVEGMSASKMRKAVLKNDFKTFRRGTPKTLDDEDAMGLFDAVQQGMTASPKRTKKQKEKKDENRRKQKAKGRVVEEWEVAPKLYPQILREKYLSDEIYNIGDTVQNMNTGLVGEIIRRGTNHLICVTEEQKMFKSWIRDVCEYYEYYYEPSIDSASVKIFINKYRKKLVD